MTGTGSELRDDFFVGYSATLRRDSPYTRVMRRFVEMLALAAVLLGLMIPLFQGSPGDGTYDVETTTMTGVVRAWPAPLLEVEREGKTSWVLLVNEFKRGAADRVEPLRDRRVTATGYRIARGGVEMLELLDGEKGLEEGEGSVVEQSAPARLVEGEAELLGEVMDSKCYLGAMRPGNGKTHLACAARCIEGGIPALLVADRIRTDGRAWDGPRHYLLIRADGRPVGASAARMAGAPTRVRGEAYGLSGSAIGVFRITGSEDGWASR